MLNWPTAMVLTAAILGGAVLYNKQGVAQFSGGGTALFKVVDYNNAVFHAHGNQLRVCNWVHPEIRIACSEWK